jgi:hypothetical protein
VAVSGHWVDRSKGSIRIRCCAPRSACWARVEVQYALCQAGLISNMLFASGVAAVVLALLGGTTWMSGGFWAPDGAYSRFVSPIIGLVWFVVVSRVLLTEVLLGVLDGDPNQELS